MPQTQIHSPTLLTLKMVEETIKGSDEDLTPTQLLKKLPRKTQYGTLKKILEYLEESRKIIIEENNIIVWVWSPQAIEEAYKNNLILK